MRGGAVVRSGRGVEDRIRNRLPQWLSVSRRLAAGRPGGAVVRRGLLPLLAVSAMGAAAGLVLVTSATAQDLVPSQR